MTEKSIGTGTISLQQMSVRGDYDNNVYFLCCGNEALLIDAADDAAGILARAEQLGVHITAVLTTHSHWDHVGALPEVLAATGAKHYAAALDAPDLPARVDVALTDGEVLSFGGHNFEIAVLRGHTKGGAALIWRQPGEPVRIFTGDSLFPGGVGKTNSPEDFQTLFLDVKTRIFDRFPDDTVIYPGHGKATTLGMERPHLAEWEERGW